MKINFIRLVQHTHSNILICVRTTGNTTDKTKRNRKYFNKNKKRKRL